MKTFKNTTKTLYFNTQAISKNKENILLLIFFSKSNHIVNI